MIKTPLIRLFNCKWSLIQAKPKPRVLTSRRKRQIVTKNSWLQNVKRPQVKNTSISHSCNFSIDRWSCVYRTQCVFHEAANARQRWRNSKKIFCFGWSVFQNWRCSVSRKWETLTGCNNPIRTFYSCWCWCELTTAYSDVWPWFLKPWSKFMSKDIQENSINS